MGAKTVKRLAILPMTILVAGLSIFFFQRYQADPGNAPVQTTQSALTGAAGRACTTVGTCEGSVYGTRVHSAFEAEVNALGNANLTTEVSYRKGRFVPRGTPGSVRLDVVEGPLTAPTAIYDLKTGRARLTPARIQQIQQHIPGGANVPVIEIRCPCHRNQVGV